MCLYSKLIKNRKYTATKKNGGNIPILKDARTAIVPIGCGKCMECRKQKSREWRVRLAEDIRTNTNGKFITLTFKTEKLQELAKDIHNLSGYELDNEICTKAVKYFRERWRKRTGKSIRHWLISELGGERYEHVHLHGILWTDEPEWISKTWQNGFVYIGTHVDESTINYITKYVTKTDKLHKEYIPKMLTSQGIGKNYVNRGDSHRHAYKGEETNELYKTKSGMQLAMPIYYRNKLYTEEEREKLWIHKLDKNERWVNGERVDISTEEGEEQYYKLLEWHRAKNERLGFGNDEINWERKRYERERRNLIHKERKLIKEEKNEQPWKERKRKLIEPQDEEEPNRKEVENI